MCGKEAQQDHAMCIYGDAPYMPPTCYNFNKYMHNGFFSRNYVSTMLSMFWIN